MIDIAQIPGWFDPRIASLFKYVDRWQREQDIHGNLCEIGAFYGRSFIPLARCAREGEKAVAVDIFDDQDENVSGSGRGYENIEEGFDANIAAEFQDIGFIEKVKGNSIVDDIMDGPVQSHAMYRMFRVDGGHRYNEVIGDLATAQVTIAPKGLVFIDDVFNPSWPDVGLVVNTVMTATVLAPLAIYLGEVVMCRPSEHKNIKSKLWKILPKHFTRMWGGWEVAIYEDQP